MRRTYDPMEFQSFDETEQQLVMAVQNNCLDDARALLTAGADPEVRFRDPWREMDCSLLHLVVLSGTPAMLHLLLAFGATVDALDEEGHTPLHTAAKFAKNEHLEVLLNAGAFVDAGNVEHDRPLHLCVSIPDPKPYQKLLEYGASPHAKNRRKRSSLDLAKAVPETAQYYDRAKQMVDTLHALPIVGDEVEAMTFAQWTKAKRDGLSFLHHPAGWNSMWTHLTDVPSWEALAKHDANGDSWLFHAVRFRQLDHVSVALKMQGESIPLEAWVDPNGKATPALLQLTENQEVHKLFTRDLLDTLRRVEVQALYRALPEEGKAQVGNFRAILLAKSRQEQNTGLGRE